MNSSALLQRYLDQTITVIATDGTQYSGQLLSGRSGEIILRQDDGQVIVVGLTNVRDLRFTRPCRRFDHAPDAALVDRQHHGRRTRFPAHLPDERNELDGGLQLSAGKRRTGAGCQRVGRADQLQRHELHRCARQANSGGC